MLMHQHASMSKVFYTKALISFLMHWKKSLARMINQWRKHTTYPLHLDDLEVKIHSSFRVSIKTR